MLMRIWGFLFNAGPQSGQKVLRFTSDTRAPAKEIHALH